MSSKRNITYKCPYCDKRFNKEDLVIHVGNKHDDMIPEGYSAFRVVFDYINKKPAGYNGKCIICGKPSGWDENKGKYNRICSNPECKKKYVQQFEERMLKSKGVKRISSTAEGQTKMLANRKISGEYKFQDGGIKSYTGTYERKALEFMDKVMNIKSEDVSTPGPIMEYMFEGKKHIYISDIYYAPYNLIIEVKDGGNNPNNRSMPEYRAKQIAKEKYIIKNTDFNYLRLTNNDFSQLLAVFMELKMEMSNDTPDRVIKINEGNLNYIEEATVVHPKKLYFVSQDNMDNRILQPRIPSNYMTKNNYEENKTPRVCFCPSIDKCLMALGQNLSNKKLYVHIVDDISKYEILKPDTSEVPDSGITNEYWICSPVKIKCIGQIICRDIGVTDDGIPYTYGDNKSASLYHWDWEWIEQIQEGFLKSEPDILYNKEAFDNGDINICFITGHSGSGKSTLAHSKESNKVEVYEMDDLQCIADRFTMDNLKEYGDLIYTYFKGPGKQFYTTWEKLKEDMTPGKDYEDKLYPGFVAYAIDWAKKHKDKKYILEGVWLFCNDETDKPYFEPSYFKDYAFYIKGTSAIKSKYRAAKRDMKYDMKEESHSRLFWIKSFTKSFFFKNWKWYKIDEKRIQVFRDYFKNKPETVLSESKDASVIEDDFKKKSGKSFKLIDLNTKEALKYVSDKWRNNKECRLAICKEDDKLAGYIYWNKSGTIAPMEVYKDYRGYGLSEILMKEAIKNGGNKLGVYSDNEVAIRLYKKLGFVETGRKKYKDGDEVIIMELKSSLNESKNKSTLDNNFKKKKIDFKYYKLDINDSDAKKYLETNSFCKKYLNYISKNSGEILVDEDNDKLIGYIWVGKSKDKGLITGLDILDNYKGYGLSEILLKDAINNYGAIHLTVDPDNEIAIHLYEKFGFVIVNYYNDNSGEYYYMKLESKLNKKEKEDAEKFKLQNVSEAYTKELGKIQRDPEIIDSYGFISSDGIYNENVKIKGFNKWLRGRSELLILDGDKLYLKKDPKKGYSIPGGGWEKDEDHNLSAIRETNEEARIKVKNVNYVSSYVAYFPPKDWVKEKISEENWWYGEYIELYIGEYDGQYKGKVDKIDQDKAMESGKFYDIKSIYNDLIPVHQEALNDIINEASISNYEFLDIKSNKFKALEYLKANSETKSYAEDTIKNYNGELIIYNNTMIGRILIGDKKDKGFITDFSIDEEHRGNKLGSRLLDDAINKYHGIDLLVDKDNKLAINMYKRRGFVVIKTIKNQYWMKLESKLKEDTDMMNEAMNALLTGYIPGSVDNPNNVYIVNYIQNNVFSDEDPNEDCIGVSSDPLFTNMIIRDKNGILKRVDESFLEDKQYKVYIVEKSRDEVNNLITANIGNFVKYGYLYEILTGKKLYTKDQVGLEGVLIPVIDYYESMDTFKEICDNYFFARDKKEESINEATFIPKEVRYFNNSGLMYSEKVYNIDEYINSKSNKVLEALDITIK